RLAPPLPEVDEPEDALTLGHAERLAPCASAEHARRAPVTRQAACMRTEQKGVDRARRRADVLLVLDQVAAQSGRREHERRRTLELRRLRGPCCFLQALERLRSEHAKAPRVR